MWNGAEEIAEVGAGLLIISYILCGLWYLSSISHSLRVIADKLRCD